MNLKSKSFNDFGSLLLKGQLKLLTFGEYSALTIQAGRRGHTQKHRRFDTHGKP